VKAQWTEDPFVYIVGHWTWPGQEGSAKTVRVYSTCDEVELFLNGKPLGRRKPESMADLIAEWKRDRVWESWPSVPPETHLRHGPFVWRDIPYAAGTLRAIGLKNGRQVVDERKTAGDAYQILLQPDRNSISGDGRDALRIVAVIADKDGVPVPSAMPWLTFHVEGPGRLLGTAVLDAVWGMAAINVLSKPGTGDITVTVSSPGLKDGKCTLRARS